MQEAKTHLQLTLVGDMKGNKKGFCRYIISKKKTREYVVAAQNRAGDMVTKDMEKAKVYSACFVSVFPDETWLQESQAPETHGNMRGEDLPLVEEAQIREDLNKLDIHNIHCSPLLHPASLSITEGYQVG